MKTCPQCESGYADHLTTCPIHGVLLNEIRDLKPGMVIHKTYRIVRKLGQGGMGSVYLARHILLDEPVALKFLSPELSNDEGLKARFLREARTLRLARHKNVIDAGTLEPAEDGSLFLSMEYVDGPDLRDFLNRAPKPFDVEMALAITRGVAEGLGAAHAKGMVHRDIKPENILIAREGDHLVPKIADFGIAAVKESSTAHTRTGATPMTMAYAAPEQWRGMRAPELDGRADLYALGCVLFEMLTGQTPFEAEDFFGWAQQHANKAPQQPSALRPELANWKGLDALVLGLLAKDREQRPKDVAELLVLLDGVVHIPPAASISPTVVETRQASRPKASEKPARRVPSWAWVSAVVVLLAVAFAPRLLFTPKPSTQPQNPPPQSIHEVQPSPPPGHDSPQPAARPDAAAIERQAVALNSLHRYSEARTLFSQACDAGSAEACDNLGEIYQSDPGVAQDFTRAIALYTKACDGGSANGCFDLGSLYEAPGGSGLAADYPRAMALLNKACDKGSASACNDLGLNYRFGEHGQTIDPGKAKQYFGRGCSMGEKLGCTWFKEMQ